MENSELMLPSGDPDKKKKKKSVDACVGGKCGPQKRGKMSLSRFNASSKKYDLPDGDNDDKGGKDEVPSGGLHMNLRNLSDDPGAVKMGAKNSKSSVTEEQERQARGFERDTRKQKKAMRLSQK